MSAALLCWHWMLAAAPSQLLGLALLNGGGLFFWWGNTRPRIYWY